MSIFGPTDGEDVVDLFAGPGGWDVAARELGLDPLGLDPLGLEVDAQAAATRDLNGLRTLQADVMALEPKAFGPTRGLIASPPCQTFSSGGGRVGVDHLDELLEALELVAAGRDGRAHAAVPDDRTLLVLEPLRWARDLRPDWVALEQVPAVLPVWEATARALEAMGYSVATDVLNAADYGVPQDRRRAVLIARQDAPAAMPQPQARVTPADVLDWDPSDLVGFPRRADRGTSVVRNGTAYRARDLRRADNVAFTVTSKARSWTRLTVEGREERVTLEEAATLQGFPANHRFAGSRSGAFLQVANAVPPPLARAVLEAAR